MNKEILELAALAAGYEVVEYVVGYLGEGEQIAEGLRIKGREDLWNPIECKADAFDLQVCLGLEVSVYRGTPTMSRPYVSVKGYVYRQQLAEQVAESNETLGEVTRLMITKAGAAIGKLIAKQGVR